MHAMNPYVCHTSRIEARTHRLSSPMEVDHYLHRVVTQYMRMDTSIDMLSVLEATFLIARRAMSSLAAID